MILSVAATRMIVPINPLVEVTISIMSRVLSAWARACLTAHEDSQIMSEAITTIAR